MWSRFVIVVWTLLTYDLPSVKAGSDKRDDRDVIIGVSIAVTLVIVIIIICVGCFCYASDVKKIRNKMRMRELIICKYRSKMIITPETPVTIEHYFLNEELDVDTLFTATVKKSEDIKPFTEKEKEVDVNRMVMTENERKQIGDILQFQNKVERLYEQQDMVTPDTISEDTVIEEEAKNICIEGKETTPEISRDDTDGSREEMENETNANIFQEFKLTDVKDDKLFTQRFEATTSIDHLEECIKPRHGSGESECSDVINSDGQGKNIDESEMKEIDNDNQSKLEDISSVDETALNEISRNSCSPISRESNQMKSPFLSLPEIDQFFDLTNTVKKSNKNKNNQNSFRTSSKKAHKNRRMFLGSEYPLAIVNLDGILSGKYRSKPDIARELKLLSLQVLVSQRLKRHKLLYSRISLPRGHQSEKDVHKTKKKKMPISQKSPNTSPRIWNSSRGSGYRSNRSHTFLSVSDIGIGLR